MKHLFYVKQWLFQLVVLSLIATGLQAQSFTALNGTVRDPTGAVIPGATLTLENVDTHVRRTAISDESGRYAFAQVAPANYRIIAEAQGFASVTVDNVRLYINNPAEVDIHFAKLGAVTQSITVKAELAPVPVDASLGNVVGTRMINELPLEGRNVPGLLSLQPGVTFIGGDTSDTRNGSVNGGKSDQANVVLDGIDVNDQVNRLAFASVLRVTLDSVQEFRVTTTNANADQGRGSGAYIALVTKSGTNALHGSAYEYNRNTIFTANSFFNNSAGVPRPALNRNVFGASLGGPVIKNHLFFFLNYEGRTDASDDSILHVVPSADLRQGILQYVRQDGTVGTLSPTEIQSIDPAGIGPDPAVLKMFQSYPQPNDSTVGDGLNELGYRFAAPVPLRWNTYIAKLDYAAGRHSLYWRGNLQDDKWSSDPQFPGQTGQENYNLSKGYAIGYTSVLQPNLVATFRYGLTRPGYGMTNVEPAAMVTFRGIDSLLNQATGATDIVPVNQLTQDLNWVHGSHTIQVGGTERWIRDRSQNFGNSFFTANGDSTWMASLGLQAGVPDLDPSFYSAFNDAGVAVLGLITRVYSNYNYDINGNVLPQGVPVGRTFAAEEYEGYVQDTWRATHALTITAGLRYSLMPPLYEANHQQVSILPNLAQWFNQREQLAAQGLSQATVAPVEYVAANSPSGGPLYPYHKRDFAPRLALAYSPQSSEGWRKRLFGAPGKTVIRAGSGMFYDMLGSGLIHQFNSASPGFSESLENPAGALTSLTAPRFTGVFDIPTQLIQPAPQGGFPIQAPDAFASTSGIDSSIKPPYTVNIDFSVGRELPGGFTVVGSYVGRLSRRSLIWKDFAQPTNLVDKASGMDYFTAADKLMLYENANTPVSAVPAIPFWEDLWPGAAGNGLTATQAIYNVYQGWGHDGTDALTAIDVNCSPSCSRLGPYAMMNQQFAWLDSKRSIGWGSYNAMQWTLRKRYSQGAQFDLNYTWSKSMDLGSMAEFEADWQQNGNIINPYNKWQNKSVSNYDMTHQFNANWLLQLPVGRGRKFLGQASRPLDAFIGGWQFAGLWRWTSGLPYGVDNGRAWPTNWNNEGFATQIGPVPRPHTTLNAPSIAGPPGPNIWPDPAAAFPAYAQTLPGFAGQRNGIRGDGYFNVDTGISKRFIMPYNEKHSIQFRWETFNAGNNVRFSLGSDAGNQQDLSLSRSSVFGKWSNQLTTPRVMQFGLRYEF
jgi:hypothetical protein